MSRRRISLLLALPLALLLLSLTPYRAALARPAALARVADLSLAMEVRDVSGKPLAGLELRSSQGPVMWFLVSNLGGAASPPCELRYTVVGDEELHTVGFEPVVIGLEVPSIQAGQRLVLRADAIMREGKHSWLGRLVTAQGEPLNDANPANDKCVREVVLQHGR